MTYFIESDNHWRISKSGYSIKVGFMDGVRIVCMYPFARTPGPLDGEKFSLWLDDAEHICELHNASIESESTISELRASIAALEAEKSERERELAAVKSVLYDEIDANLAFRDACGASDDEDMPTFCARIVFELRELRTRMAERERQEPVAWVLFDDIFIAPKDMQDDPPNLECMKPLYAHPLALREPTEDECREIRRLAKNEECDGSKVCEGRAMFKAVREVMTK